MDKFENWFNKVNEELTESPAINTEVAAVADVEVDADRSNMIGDIDTIMTSLETLASELTEELAIDLEDLNEAGTKDFIKSWIIGIKATKSQEKVNKIKMNASDLEFAADKFEGDKKKSIIAKSEKVKIQAKQLQDMVNDRFNGSGDYVKRKLHKAKIKGQLEIIKRTTGMEDNPGKKSNMVTKMKELSKKYQEENAAIAELEDDNKEVIADKKKELKEGPKKKEENTEQDAPEDKDTRTDAEKQADAKIASDKEAEDEEKTTKESLIYRATEASLLELASEISEKADWQLDNTVLYTKYDTIIKKAGYDSIITESSSIKDKFNTLLNS